MKKIIKTIGIVFLVFVLVVAGYVGYVFATYYRLPDKQKVSIRQYATDEVVDLSQNQRIVTANLGFGAYSDDFSFFMDGGDQSRAYSEKAVKKNIQGSLKAVASLKPNFVFFQEVDTNGTRSHHIDEDDLLQKGLPDYSSTWTQNYDSPYLMYPLNHPHGKNKSGLTTFSDVQMQSAIRRSLPIEEGFSKFMDLDRCYVKQRLQTSKQKDLVLYNVHLSAYTSDSSTADKQLKMLFKDMQKEANKGNYVIAGGNFNKDLLGNSDQVFNKGKATKDSWAKPIKKKMIPKGFHLVEPENQIPSCRNANQKYAKSSNTYLLDGFIVCDTITVNKSEVLDTKFKYSDHNPVYLDFKG